MLLFRRVCTSRTLHRSRTQAPSGTNISHLVPIPHDGVVPPTDLDAQLVEQLDVLHQPLAPVLQDFGGGFLLGDREVINNSSACISTPKPVCGIAHTFAGLSAYTLLMAFLGPK